MTNQIQYPQNDQIYETFSKALYRITGDEGYDSIMDSLQSNANANPSASGSVSVAADAVDSGQSASSTVQAAGAQLAGKKTFNDTTDGYFLGIVQGKGVFNLGGASAYIQWDGTTLTVVGGVNISSLNIPDSVTANSFHVDISGNTWWGANVATGYSGANAYVLSTGASVFKNISVGGTTLQYVITNSGIFSFGDGSDGTATFDGTNTFSYASLASNVYTLTRDIYLDSATVNGVGPVSLPTSLLSYYKLDESSGTASDSIGGRNLTNNNTVAYASGLINNAADFGTSWGSNKSLSNTAFATDLRNDFSISLWVKLRTAIGATEGFLIDWRSTTGANRQFLIKYNNTNGGTLRIDAAGTTIDYTVVLSQSAWQHIVVTKSSGTVTIYYNGVSVATGSFGTTGGSNFFKVGGDTSTHGAAAYIDEVGLWTKALSVSEITSLYNSDIGIAYPLSSVTLNAAGYRIFVKTALTVKGFVNRDGNTGGVGSAGGNGTVGGVGGGGGGGGSAAAALSDGYLKGSLAGTAGGNGKNGNTSGGGTGSAGGAGSNTLNSLGTNGASGTSGTTGGTGAGTTTSQSGTAGTAGGAGGTVTASNVKLIANWHLATLLDISSSGATVKFDNSASCGGAGGGGGGGLGGNGGGNDGGGGGGGGGGGTGGAGGIVAIYAKAITVTSTGAITSNGGTGGVGGAGGLGNTGASGGFGGGGAGGTGGTGGNGGVLILTYNQLTNSGTISASAGSGGAGGAGGAAAGGAATAGSAGATGTAGAAGVVYNFQLSL